MAAAIPQFGPEIPGVTYTLRPGGYAHAFSRGGYTFDPAIHMVPEASYFMIRVHSTWASGARAMGVPG